MGAFEDMAVRLYRFPYVESFRFRSPIRGERKPEFHWLSGVENDRKKSGNLGCM